LSEVNEPELNGRNILNHQGKKRFNREKINEAMKGGKTDSPW
jgi:hypothetical protein